MVGQQKLLAMLMLQLVPQLLMFLAAAAPNRTACTLASDCLRMAWRAT
jgi:hypothetical protein